MTAVEAPTSKAWITRRMRAVVASTLPNLPNASCKGYRDPDLWHPERPNRRQEFRAIGICGHCPVKVECLSYAMRAHPIQGIWGGTTYDMRMFLEREDIVIEYGRVSAATS